MAHFTIRFVMVLAAFFALQSVAHGKTISMSSDITPDSMKRLVAKVAEASAAGDRNITVALDSNGGNLGAALNAAAQLKKYGVNTSVGNMCASSCTVLFAAGKVRSASYSAQFMFHAVHVETSASVLEKLGVTKEQLRVNYSNMWLGAVRGASPKLADLLAKNKTLYSGVDVYYSGRTLRDYGYVND